MSQYWNIKVNEDDDSESELKKHGMTWLIPILEKYVLKEKGKGLSSNDFTNNYLSKLVGIEDNAEVNVQSDWDENNVDSDTFVKNKESLCNYISDNYAFNVTCGNSEVYLSKYARCDICGNPIETTYAKKNGEGSEVEYSKYARCDICGNPIETTYALDSQLCTVAKTGNYNDLTNIPTKLTDFSNDLVNNVDLCITCNGILKGKFSTNQSESSYININVPTNNNQLLNGCGYAFISECGNSTVSDSNCLGGILSNCYTQKCEVDDLTKTSAKLAIYTNNVECSTVRCSYDSECLGSYLYNCYVLKSEVCANLNFSSDLPINSKALKQIISYGVGDNYNNLAIGCNAIINECCSISIGNKLFYCCDGYWTGNPIEKAIRDGCGNVISETYSTRSITDEINKSVSCIYALIPNEATNINQLADKEFVNSTIQTNSANFRGNWETWDDVPSDETLYPSDYSGSTIPTPNDYLVVMDASSLSVVPPEGVDTPSDKLVLTQLPLSEDNNYISVYSSHKGYYILENIISESDLSIKVISYTDEEKTYTLNANSKILLPLYSNTTIKVILDLTEDDVTWDYSSVLNFYRVSDEICSLYEGTWRLKYLGVWSVNGKNGWHLEYKVNTSPFTANQLSSLNSGMNASLTNKLISIEDNAEVNVQSDWNENDESKDSFILNKPTLVNVACSGDYNDLINTPTKLSEFENDTNYSTCLGTVTDICLGNKKYSQNNGIIELPAYATKLSEFENDTNYSTCLGTVTTVCVGGVCYAQQNGVISLPDYCTAIPTNISAFNNDVGYSTCLGTVTDIYLGDVKYSQQYGIVNLPAYATKLSEFENDTNYSTCLGTVIGICQNNTLYSPDNSGYLVLPNSVCTCNLDCDYGYSVSMCPVSVCSISNLINDLNTDKYKSTLVIGRNNEFQCCGDNITNNFLLIGKSLKSIKGDDSLVIGNSICGYDGFYKSGVLGNSICGHFDYSNFFGRCLCCGSLVHSNVFGNENINTYLNDSSIFTVSCYSNLFGDCNDLGAHINRLNVFGNNNLSCVESLHSSNIFGNYNYGILSYSSIVGDCNFVGQCTDVVGCCNLINGLNNIVFGRNNQFCGQNNTNSVIIGNSNSQLRNCTRYSFCNFILIGNNTCFQCSTDFNDFIGIGNDLMLSECFPINIGNKLLYDSSSCMLTGCTFQNACCLGTLPHNCYALKSDLFPKDHSSECTTYGVGTNDKYGHLKISDSYMFSCGSSANGIASSSLAVFNAYECARCLNNNDAKFKEFISTDNLVLSDDFEISKIHAISCCDIESKCTNNILSSFVGTNSNGYSYVRHCGEYSDYNGTNSCDKIWAFCCNGEFHSPNHIYCDNERYALYCELPIHQMILPYGKPSYGDCVGAMWIED